MKQRTSDDMLVIFIKNAPNNPDGLVRRLKACLLQLFDGCERAKLYFQEKKGLSEEMIKEALEAFNRENEGLFSCEKVDGCGGDYHFEIASTVSDEE